MNTRRQRKVNILSQRTRPRLCWARMPPATHCGKCVRSERHQYLVHGKAKALNSRAVRSVLLGFRWGPCSVESQAFTSAPLWNAPAFSAICEPTCGFVSDGLSAWVPRHVSGAIARSIAEFEHVFSSANGFIRADLHKHDTVQYSNNNHKILWSV